MQLQEAEMRLVRTLLAEARAAVASRQAEIELAKVREDEAQSRVQYYSRLNEEAANNLVDAELQVGVIRHRISKHGKTEQIEHIAKDFGVDYLQMNLAKMLLSRVRPSKPKPALFNITRV
ncbi:hypothetical protein B0H13DRAFT_1905105 [Mycena leptocephala]|nr:hypothetical protein B0H13DRAFT_1905105 [Mycena leptocephala]